MLSQLLGQVELTTWALISTPIFTVVFLFIVFRTFGKSKKSEMERMGRLPLEEEAGGQS